MNKNGYNLRSVFSLFSSDLAIDLGTANTLVFSHGHVLRVMGARWIGLPAVEGRCLGLDTATVCMLGWEREVPVISRWNDPCHLLALPAAE